MIVDLNKFEYNKLLVADTNWLHEQIVSIQKIIVKGIDLFFETNSPLFEENDLLVQPND